MEDLFDIDNFNIIEDEENYYFFRALNMADNQDFETGTTLGKEGNIERIRTDRERYEGTTKYTEDSEISLEEIYDHIKMHYRKDTNCISLSSNANVSISYGRGFYKDKYVIVKVSKKEFGEKVINAGQYMLEEIRKKVEEYISISNLDSKIVETLAEIDKAQSAEEIKKAIEARYTSKEELDPSKAGLRKGIYYRAPHARISSYQALSEEQALEKNKIVAKLTLLERVGDMEPLIPHTANNNLLVQTIGNAFSSLEVIHYGDIQQEDIIDIPKEIVDIFALLQQVEGQNQEIVRELKKEVIQFISEGRNIEIPENSSLLRNDSARENITIEEMYELTNGKVEYGMANSIVKNMFYLAKGQLNARSLAELLREITNNNPKYERVIEYIENNGFEIQPQILTRQNKKGYKLSESVSLNLKPNEIGLVQQIRSLTDKEQIEILENGGLSNVRDIMTSNFTKVQTQEKLSKEYYYAEAIFSSYDWQSIGIEQFTVAERNNLLQRIQDEHCVELYKKLEKKGIDRKDIPKILLNIITRKRDSENTKEQRLEQYDRMLEGDISAFGQELSIERIERFLGYYDVKGTGIQLRPYQQRAVEKTDEIFEKERFASVILPTGAGKSFVALSQLMEHKDEEILYLAPQNEILEQMKDYIIKYIHGPVNTIGRTKDEIIADIFPNLKFSTYPGLLSKASEEIINKQYGFVVLDELHRTGAKEWGEKLDTLIDNQTENTKVLGITATPRRDADGKNMANEIAERLGYTNKDATAGKHIAMNMSLTNAIKMGLVVNPKLVSCAYSLKTDGSLENLKGRIDQIEDVQKRNEQLEKYETLRRNLEEAEGIPEILQANVKKGGKYIVFLPVVDEIEDEDGNVIGRKKGKEKLADYEKQILEYFKDSDIKPNFHSMLGEYGDKENNRRLEEFQNRDTDETEFMLVMNKANEGLHLDKLDGIIWLRALDENSRILYLQQLGRVMYSEASDNPTKDEDRPVVIDLVNNTLKVNWDNEITEQDDIELLTIIVDLSEKHDGTLPDINSNDKEEAGYATVLKDIQNKYKAYLDNDFEDLNEKQIEEVQEILRLGSLIELWERELPDRVAKNGENNKKGLGIDNGSSFQLVGVLKDFVEIENEVEEIEGRNAVERFIYKLEKLHEIGIDVSKLSKRDTIQTLAEKSGITKEQLEEAGLNLNDNIGMAKSNVASAYRGISKAIPPTEEQVKRLLELGISLGLQEKKNVTQEFIENLQKLQEIGVDVSKLSATDTIEELAKKSRVDIEQLKKIGLNLKENIGRKKNYIISTYRGNNEGTPPTEEQLEILSKLGINIELKRKSAIEILIENLRKLQEIGVDVSKLTAKDTIQSLASKSNISLDKLKEYGLDLDNKIGNAKENIAQRYRKKDADVLPTEEQVSILSKMGISLCLQRKNAVDEFISNLEALQEIGIDVSKIKTKDTIETLAQRFGIELEYLKQTKLDLNYRIGKSKDRIKQSLKGKKGNLPPTKEQMQKLKELGVDLDVKRITGKEIAEASISSLKDVEMADEEDKALREVVEKTKEGGILISE